MDGLIPFTDSVQRIEEQKAVKALAPDPTVIQLRERLLSSNYADSLDTRVSLLAEVVFRTYIHHLQLIRDHQHEDHQA